MLEKWLVAIGGADHTEVAHILYVVGDEPPIKDIPSSVEIERCQGLGGVQSIGHYHNFGAEQANSEWIMKLDIDTFPHVNFFPPLLEILEHARPKEWFNVGMIYVNRAFSLGNLSVDRLPLTTAHHMDLVNKRRMISEKKDYPDPQATNWVIRKSDYQAFGGCDPRFRGYGWEDYQQIYAMERQWRGQDPLPGHLDLGNVTRRCRDEIARPKALQLFERNFQLCLLHHWHSDRVSAPPYKAHVSDNKKVLLDCIQKLRG